MTKAPAAARTGLQNISGTGLCGGSGARPRGRELLAAALLGVDGFLEVLASLEADRLAGLDRDRLAGGGVASLGGAGLGDPEASQAGDLDRLARLQRSGDRADDGFERRRGLAPGEALHGIHNAIHQINL